MGQGPATASQTAWATMALMAAVGPDDPDVQRGIQWLCDTQLNGSTPLPTESPRDHDGPGSWREPWFTGTGFPRVFYLRYHLYRLYFPIMCLGRWRREIETAKPKK
jgi:squalene-hopene/tetraprenyl-beta-curcumene cyclase